MTNTDIIITFIKELQKEDLPDDIIITIKTCVLDYLGVTFAGCYDNRDKFYTYLDMKPDHCGCSPIIGLNRKGTIEDAALLNGIAAHYLELDDGSRFGMVHLGAPILSALFAISEIYKISYDRFIRAVFVGYETAIRLSSAIQPGHKVKGFHSTGTCGCIGAAAAVATAMNFDNQSLINAISVAVASASGLLEMIDNVSQLKPFNAGKAAQNAITAAMIGKSGYYGPTDPIGGNRGFLRVMSESFNEEWFNKNTDIKYSILGIYRKPYASCRHCHPAVEAALTIGNNISSKDIGKIEVYTYSLAVYGHDHTDIKGVNSAKMSIPYSVASAIVMNTGGIETMSEDAIKNSEILELTKKVKVIEKKEFSALVPSQRISEVLLYLIDGRILKNKVIYPKGEPENPMTESEIVEKFCQLILYSGREENFCKEIISCVENLECKYDKLLNLL